MNRYFLIELQIGKLFVPWNVYSKSSVVIELNHQRMIRSCSTFG